jgi:NAD(P)-dependent dehydrogenase (short-subunit alcohol dehydrogenase family)
LPVALITGASSGIGAAAARRFAAAGFDLLLLARRTGSLEALAAELRLAHSSRIETAGIDLSEPSAIAAGIAELCGRGLLPAVLINNAGIKSAERLFDGDRAKIAWTLSVNTDSVLNLSRQVYADSMKGRGGRIVNIGSSLSSRGAVFNYQAGGADYCYSKAIVHDLTRLLAYEAAPNGVTVNAVAPGIIHTPMHGRPAEETEARHVGRIPLGRIGQPDDLVGATMFLVSDAAAYITGQVLHVNGGMLMTN